MTVGPLVVTDLVVLLGPSGSGKTKLVEDGVVAVEGQLRLDSHYRPV